MSLRTFLGWLVGLLILLLAALWVGGTIRQHVKEHRHCRAYATTSIERTEQAERYAAGELDDCHGQSVKPGAPDKHVRGGKP